MRTPRRGYEWELLVLCWLAFFLNQADRQAFNVMIPLLRRDLGLSSSQLGWIAGLFSLAFALSLPLAGYAGDLLSRKKVILWSLLVWSAATTLTSMTTGFLSLIALRSLATGGGEAFYFPSANSLIGQFHARRRALAMSIHQTSLYAGLIASGFLAGWAGERYGWRSTFIFFGLPGLVLAAVFAARVIDSPQPGRLSQTGLSALRAGWGGVLRRKTACMLAFAFLCMVFVNVGYLTWMPAYLHERFSMPLANAGFSSMFYHHVAAFAGVLAGGVLSDRWARRRRGARLEMAAGAFLIGAPFIVLLGASPAPEGVYLGLGGFGLCRGVYEANMWAALFDVIPEPLRAQGTGVFVCLAYIVGTLSPVLLGVASEQGSLSGALSWLGVVYLAAGAAILLARWRFFAGEYLEVAEAAA